MSADRISARELQELLAAGQHVTVVDIRPPADREWSIPGSLQIDAYDDAKSGSLGPLADFDFRTGPVVTVCGMGATAAKATGLLRAKGVQAMTLEGGMRCWSLAWNTAQTTVGEIRDSVALARLDSAAFVEAVLARIPPNPANHFRIVELNERGDVPGDPSEVEAGANRCAVA
ncbi:MAG: rhodanese-like domain-containing protein [Candidatus Dormibacteraceae bacterium]